MQEKTEERKGRKERTEERIMRISFCGSAVLVASELVMAIVLHSYSVLMDGIFGVADLVLMGPILLMIPLLYRPVTERRPYGYSQMESLFLLIKYGVLLFIIGQMIIQNIRVIIHGGHHVNVTGVAVFEFLMFWACVGMYVLLSYFAKKYESITIKSELFMWKVDVISSIGLTAAFFAQVMLGKGILAFLEPYIDSVVAIICSAFLLVEPVQGIITSIKELLLFAPPEPVMEEIRTAAEGPLKKYNYELNFLDVIQTGRKTWIEVYIESQHRTIHIDHLYEVSRAIKQKLADRFDQVYVELIPVLPEDEVETSEGGKE